MVDLITICVSLYQFLVLVVPSFQDTEHLTLTLVLYGFATQMTEFFIEVIIPLIIASRVRAFHEFTKAGTVIGVVNIGFFISLLAFLGLAQGIEYLIN